jgi:hypothetical protein
MATFGVGLSILIIGANSRLVVDARDTGQIGKAVIVAPLLMDTQCPVVQLLGQLVVSPR